MVGINDQIEHDIPAYIEEAANATCFDKTRPTSGVTCFPDGM